MNDIEKAARLMRYEIAEKFQNDVWVYMDEHKVYTVPFNPRTNKADLVDVEIELGIGVSFYHKWVMAIQVQKTVHSEEIFKDHPTKFAARAEAVMSVVSQLYDAKFKKDDINETA